jgi:hypothetical protein
LKGTLTEVLLKDTPAKTVEFFTSWCIAQYYVTDALRTTFLACT